MSSLYRLEIPLGIYYAPIPAAGTIVVGVPGKRIVLISCGITVGANTSLQWQTSTGLVALTGFMPITATGGYILPFNAGGWFETLFNDSLVLNASPNVALGGCISYLLDGP